MLFVSGCETVKVRYTSDKIKRIEQIKIGDMIDLRSAEDVFIKEGESYIISLGVAMQLPKGYFAEVVPRSSLFNNFGLVMVNSVGIIDESYCGNDDVWRFQALCVEGKYFKNGVKDTQVSINDRLCQFRIVEKMPELDFIEVDNLGNANRGGIGSTGVD